MNSPELWENVSNSHENKYHPLKNILKPTCSLKTFPSHIYCKIHYEVICLDFEGKWPGRKIITKSVIKRLKLFKQTILKLAYYILVSSGSCLLCISSFLMINLHFIFPFCQIYFTHSLCSWNTFSAAAIVLIFLCCLIVCCLSGVGFTCDSIKPNVLEGCFIRLGGLDFN